jgi:hypothetical protein
VFSFRRGIGHGGISQRANHRVLLGPLYGVSRIDDYLHLASGSVAEVQAPHTAAPLLLQTAELPDLDLLWPKRPRTGHQRADWHGMEGAASA